MKTWAVVWMDGSVSVVTANNKMRAALLLDEIGDALDGGVRWVRMPEHFTTWRRGESWTGLTIDYQCQMDEGTAGALYDLMKTPLERGIERGLVIPNG